MGLYQTLPADINEVDVIIAGGGTAGCIVAARLAAADPNLSVLVIEAGQNNYNVPNVVTPVLFKEHLAPDSTTSTCYKGKKSEALLGREPTVPTGRILGGGSSINSMMYTRAQGRDYDAWEMPGWGCEDLLPFLKKLETFHGNGSATVHGFSGPIHVSDGGYRAARPAKDFISAATQVGFPEIRDLQDLKSVGGVGYWLRTVSKDGKRQDTAHRYLHPLLGDGQHPNLHVLVETLVNRVLFNDSKQACGIEYLPNPAFQAQSANIPQNHRVVIKARRLVIVASGAFGSPLLLERSGVGNWEVLQKASVPLIADVPGVGENYQDHNLALWPYMTNLEPHETNDALLSGRWCRDDLLSLGHPMRGWNAIDVAAKVRPTESEVAELGPEFKAAWDKDFRDEPGKPMMLFDLINSYNYLGDRALYPKGQFVSVGIYTAYPYSRGNIHITGPSVKDTPAFDPGFFTDANDIDLKKHIWAYKKQREVMRHTQMYRGEAAPGHPNFPPGSPAACVDLRTVGPTTGDIHPIEYSAEDDAAIELFLRKNIETTWHSLGTAKMAPRNEMGVVDCKLDVYGVRGLKIVDVSICPQNVGANTNNTAMIIGEKAADIVLKELGLNEGSLLQRYGAMVSRIGARFQWLVDAVLSCS